MTIILKPSRRAYELILKTLKKGGTIIYPTETSYGIGCDATNPKAIKNVKKIKKRKKNNFITIVSDMKMAEKYGYLTKLDKKVIKKFMPGPLTLVVKKKRLPNSYDKKEFAFRISSNKISHKLSKTLNKPLLSTSANISSKKPIFNIENVFQIFDKKVEIIIDSGKLKRGKQTTVIDLFNGLNIRRYGRIKKSTLKKFIDKHVN